ncbi:hypothetical protein KKC44_05380 [Patescibacteria group bacterium]|nr:hypothetical protein [Patescibacteria group bacterium]MBU2260005.1 hypothetical protein [Patescibacteria group bacterium]
MTRPMPLKHATETLLVFLLGVFLVIIGVLTATLPSLPEGALPWGVLIVIAVLYPLVLTQVFRRNRADYAFRWLHWFPAFILLLWLGLELIGIISPSAKVASSAFTWGWTLPFVALGFVGVIAFCLHVIRRRIPRILLLLAVFLPFVVLATINERGGQWEQKLAQVLWEAQWMHGLNGTMTGTGTEIAMEDEREPKNLDESEDPAEEAWRERLRAFEERRQQIAIKMAEQEQERGAQGPQETPAPSTGTGREFREAITSPTALPSSGAGAGFLGLTMLMGYCGVLHQRVRRRVC